ncbi:MAG: ATP-binding protein [Candidatus Omnitrophota bacterium]
MEKKIFAAKLENLDAMMDFIREGGRTAGFNDKKLNHLQLAAEEVLVNIINHGYVDKEGDIQITLSPPREKTGLKVEVIDEGIAFNPLTLPEPDLDAPLEKREIGGLGVYLLRKLMDEVDYKREENRNILTFVKY